jgi:monovalent cation/proton antiporter MnhG/PhaG subunit
VTGREVAEAVALLIGAAAILLCCLGVGVARNVYDRLHFLSALGTVGAAAVVAAVVVKEGLSSAGLKAVVVLVATLVTGPVLTHAIARAARIREGGHPGRAPSERAEAGR